MEARLRRAQPRVDVSAFELPLMKRRSILWSSLLICRFRGQRDSGAKRRTNLLKHGGLTTIRCDDKNQNYMVMQNMTFENIGILDYFHGIIPVCNINRSPLRLVRWPSILHSLNTFPTSISNPLLPQCNLIITSTDCQRIPAHTPAHPPQHTFKI